MKTFFFVFLITISTLAQGLELNGFRVKHAWSGALKDKENFFNIPRTKDAATEEGYFEVPRTQDHSLDVCMLCLQNDPRVCPLYDNAGTIAGLQIAIPFNDLKSLPYDVATKMIMKTILGEDYWTTTYYVTSPDTLKRGGRIGEIKQTIEGLWVQNGPNFMQIPTGESELKSQTLFKKQNCIPTMGTHYYYNMTAETDCHSVFPYFPLVKEGKIIGLGWQIIGKSPEDKYERKWFEHGSSSRAVEISIPTAPPCLQDWVKNYGFVSLHMYFVDEPWKIKCEDTDSVQPMSVVNKLLLTTTRYSGKVVDEVKKLFGL